MEHFIILDDCVPDRESLLKQAYLPDDSDEAEDFLLLASRIYEIAKPKAYMKSLVVKMLDYPRLALDSIPFQGSIIFDNLKEQNTAWGYIATCGVEAYDLVMAIDDSFERFWGELVLESLLSKVEKELRQYISTEIYSGKTAYISPGSLMEWPLKEQIPLFQALGDGPERCGVKLTCTLLMLPNKSISGIRFPNEHGYVNCRLCPRTDCPNRQAVYDASLAK